MSAAWQQLRRQAVRELPLLGGIRRRFWWESHEVGRVSFVSPFCCRKKSSDASRIGSMVGKGGFIWCHCIKIDYQRTFFFNS